MRVYLRKPYQWAPSRLIFGTQQISVCAKFAKWFRRKFGEEAALQDVWEAVAKSTMARDPLKDRIGVQCQNMSM